MLESIARRTWCRGLGLGVGVEVGVRLGLALELGLELLLGLGPGPPLGLGLGSRLRGSTWCRGSLRTNFLRSSCLVIGR